MDKSDQDRIDGRKWAQEIVEDVDSRGEDFKAGLWRELRRRSPQPDPLKLGLMSDEQAREFGRGVITFGKHVGDRYDEVPLDYLEWLTDQGRELARYVGSRRVQAEHQD